jgi:4-hydroxyphenylpyruvate dioxygenase
MNKHLIEHGDGVRDIALTVENSRAIYDYAISHGATSIKEPYELTDENGTVVLSSIKTYGDTIHTFVERSNYKGPFLPGFKAHHLREKLNDILPPVRFERVDHVVGNQPDLEMEPAVKLYEDALQFHRFWSVDDSIMHTAYSALRSIVVTDFHENIKMPINEPAVGKKKSQIQEYVDYYHGAGAQHIALKTSNIIEAVTNLTARGVEFLTIPDTYYDNIRKNLSSMSVHVKEDIDVLQKYKILLDHDEKGYLLQIFTKPIEDRPTLFYEVIQRNNH